MFTGFIEATTSVVSAVYKNQSISLVLKRPEKFHDLSTGDSLACNGVCLNLEEFDKQIMKFTIGYETLRITGWKAESIPSTSFNLERSLKFGGAVHGHLVTGHVDVSTQLTKREEKGNCLLVNFQLPEKQKPQIYEKCYIAINGVSLTVNDVDKDQFQVCLVPETLRQTQLGCLKKGNFVNIETDYCIKGLVKAREFSRGSF